MSVKLLVIFIIISKRYPSTYGLITRTRTSTYILFCDKTQVPMLFYFDSKTARSILPL